jgi:Na+-driven multidrug efflux pump
LAVYPAIASIVVSDSTILDPGKQALFWLTLAIPSRMLQLASAMVLHGSGQGRKVLWVNVLELFANALLDYLFIFRFGYGFQGGYIGTFICSWFSLGGTLYLLRKQILWSRLVIFDRTWTIEFLRKASCELGRLFSERLAALALLWIFSAGSVPTAGMSAFAVASELMFFVGIPCIAAMRSVGIILAPLQKESVFELYQALRSILMSGLILIFGLAMGIYIFAPAGGNLLYRLSSDAMLWWRPFVLVFSLTLPFKWIGSIQRGVWQSKGDFKTLALLDFCLEWFIVLPLALLGVRSNQPWLAWSGYLLCDIVLVSALLLMPGIRSAGHSRVEAAL